MTFTDEAPVLSIAQPYATLCFTPTEPCNVAGCDPDALPPCPCHRPEWCADDPAVGCDLCRVAHPPLRMVKTIETRSRPMRSIVGRRIWIASTVAHVRFGTAVGDWVVVPGPHSYEWDIKLRGNPMAECHPVHFGCILGSVHVADCLPIQRCSGTDPHICNPSSGLFAHSDLRAPFPDGQTEHVITDQLPYGDYTPGRYGLIFTDPEPLPDPVPFKGGQGLSKRWKP